MKQTGYADKWIIEIDRPKIEGFEEAQKHIKAAEDSLFKRDNPPDALDSLTRAWNVFKDIIKNRRD